MNVFGWGGWQAYMFRGGGAVLLRQAEGERGRESVCVNMFRWGVQAEGERVYVCGGAVSVGVCVYGVCGRESVPEVHTPHTTLTPCAALPPPPPPGKGVSVPEQQEAALEGVLDLCRQPGFVHDVFANCDCRIERSNLFENICR